MCYVLCVEVLFFYLSLQILDAWQCVVEVFRKNLYALVCCDGYRLVITLKAILCKDVVLAATDEKPNGRTVNLVFQYVIDERHVA